MAPLQSKGYRGPQVCKLIGITYRQLDYWARTGLLRPSLSDAKGSGSQRVYSYLDVVELKVIKQLLDSGVNLQKARKAIACLRESGDELATASLVLADEQSVLVQSGEEIVDLLRGGQGVFNIMPMAGVMSELEAAIREFNVNAESEPEHDAHADSATITPLRAAEGG